MINKLEKANTENINPLFSGKYGFACAMRYVARKDIKEYHTEVFKIAQEAIDLAQVFAGFIEFKEKQLVKEAKYFNEFEKCIALEEFREIYNIANKLLDNKL